MSRARFPWNRLGIDETSDTAAIRKAYADALRATNVDEDIAGYAELRRARNQALWLAAQSQRTADEADADEGALYGLGGLDDDYDDDDGWDADDHAWDIAPGLQPVTSGPVPFADSAPAPTPELTAAQAQAQAAWQGLLDILYPDGEASEDSVTYAQMEEGLAHLAVLLDHADAVDIAEHDALDHALADIFARTWPRSAPFVEPANAALHWLEEAGTIEERPSLMFLNQRLKGMRFHEKVQRPDHPLHKAWTELARPGRASMFDRLRVKRLEVDKLLTGIRERYPELESYLDPQRVASWDGGEGSDGTGPRFVRGIVIVLLVVALPRLISQCSTAPDDDQAPPVAEASATLEAVQADVAANAIFGEGVDMAAVRAADSVFADQLRLTLNSEGGESDAALAFARVKALGAAEIADYNNLAVRADLRSMWMAAAKQQSAEACRKVMAGDFIDLDLDLDSRQRDRERALMRQLLEAKLLSHFPQGGSFQYSIPGWLVNDALTRSGLSKDKLTAALSNPDSPDRCAAESALIEAVRATSKRVPEDVLKGL
jgi:hypothetical protein